MSLTSIVVAVHPGRNPAEHQAPKKKRGPELGALPGDATRCARAACRSDAGHAVTISSEFSPKPAAAHCSLLQGVTEWLRAAGHCGGLCEQGKRMEDLQARALRGDSKLPEQEMRELPDKLSGCQLKGFADATNASCLTSHWLRARFC